MGFDHRDRDRDRDIFICRKVRERRHDDCGHGGGNYGHGGGNYGYGGGNYGYGGGSYGGYGGMHHGRKDCGCGKRFY